MKTLPQYRLTQSLPQFLSFPVSPNFMERNYCSTPLLPDSSLRSAATEQLNVAVFLKITKVPTFSNSINIFQSSWPAPFRCCLPTSHSIPKAFVYMVLLSFLCMLPVILLMVIQGSFFHLPFFTIILSTSNLSHIVSHHFPDGWSFGSNLA